MTEFGTGLPKFLALQQVGSYLGVQRPGAGPFGKAARDPRGHGAALLTISKGGPY